MECLDVPKLKCPTSSSWFRETLHLDNTNSPQFDTIQAQLSARNAQKEFYLNLMNQLNKDVWNLPNYSYSELAIESLVLTSFSLKEIHFMRRCFFGLSSLEFTQLPQLRKLSIGDYSFHGKKVGRFILQDLNMLEEIQIGRFCFESSYIFGVFSRTVKDI